MQLRVVSLFVCLLLGNAMGAQAQSVEVRQPETAPAGAVLDLESYKRTLQSLEEASRDPKNLPASVVMLPSEWTVVLKNQTFHVSTSEITDAMDEMHLHPDRAKKILPKLQARLAEMRRLADSLTSGKSIEATRASAKSKLEEILKRREFKEKGGPTAAQLLRARISRWIWDQLDHLFSFIHIGESTSNYVAWGLIGATVLIVFVFLYRRLAKLSGPSELVAEAEPVASDARQWLQEAHRLAGLGQYRDAIHCAYWASISKLEDKRMLARDRTRTPRESLRLLDRHPEEQGVLRAITRNLELIWYGYRPASEADWVVTREQLEKMGCVQG